ncbi:hypothetical protein [Burkholderia cenocepacia]|uniref:hypothetical protein n=1 Tax=Burkholderia cenocepacia TaxID=95486 RepID=UPI000F566F56|nr:hypothetical protein [Burkholderia cenocepacia]RQU97762.1 hypothetical protein DF042_26960 [Burkholderia cenocepacia]
MSGSDNYRYLSWVRMPTWWTGRPEIHQALAKAPTGVAIAALKLYLAVCSRASRKSTEFLPRVGSVCETVSNWIDIVGVSRPMVIEGFRLLIELGLVEQLQRRPGIYALVGYDGAGYWTRLPHKHLAGTGSPERILRLVEMSNRSRATLHALQVYVYLASIRDRKTLQATVSYARMTEVLAMQRADVSQALSTLAAHHLVSMRHNDYDPVTRRKLPGVYWLKGRMGVAGEDQLFGPED